MARAATVPLVRTATLYAWLADREERAARTGWQLVGPEETGGVWCYRGSPQRLAELRAGEPVDMAAMDVPQWARAGKRCRWCDRAVVDADGGVQFYTDDGSAWLAESGL